MTMTVSAQRGGGDGGEGGFRGGPPGGGGGFRGGPPGGGAPGGFRGGPPGGSRGGAPGGDRGSRGGFDPSSFLTRLDTNGNGVLDPDEQQGPAQFLISRLQQSDPSIKAGQPISIKKVSETFTKMREQGTASRGNDPRSGNAADEALETELLVPGFGVDSEPIPLMGFGPAAELLAVPVTDDDKREAAERMRRYDRNRDGFLTKDELSSRFAGNPMDFDRNKDGKLSESELAVRYARRREGEEEAKKAKRDDRRGRDGGGKVELADPYNKRTSYRNLATAKLPEGLPGFFSDRDANNDGQVTMAEYSSEWSDELISEYFAWDLNSDGTITALEARDAVESGFSLKAGFDTLARIGFQSQRTKFIRQQSNTRNILGSRGRAHRPQTDQVCRANHRSLRQEQGQSADRI